MRWSTDFDLVDFVHTGPHPANQHSVLTRSDCDWRLQTALNDRLATEGVVALKVLTEAGVRLTAICWVEVPLFDGVDQPVASSLQVCAAVSLLLDLPYGDLGCEIGVGDGVGEPAGEVSAFEVVLECLRVDMQDCGVELMHGAGTHRRR